MGSGSCRKGPRNSRSIQPVPMTKETLTSASPVSAWSSHKYELQSLSGYSWYSIPTVMVIHNRLPRKKVRVTVELIVHEMPAMAPAAITEITFEASHRESDTA